MFEQCAMHALHCTPDAKTAVVRKYKNKKFKLLKIKLTIAIIFIQKFEPPPNCEIIRGRL